jgi:hypothetical protein
MAQTILPLDSLDSQYSVDVSLSLISYRLSLYWNERGQFWTLDIADTNEVIIAASIKLVADWELLGNLTQDGLPPGKLLCVDMSGASLDPGPDDLGTRVILVYDDGK